MGVAWGRGLGGVAWGRGLCPHPLLQRYVLPDEARDLVRLVGLQPRDPLLHQVAALHVEEQGAVFRLDLARGDHLREGVV